MALSPAQARRERAALLRAINRDLKSKDRAKLLALRDRIRAAVRARREAIARARSWCARKRAVPTQRQAIAMQREAKALARRDCDAALRSARALRDPIAIARAERAAEAKHQRDLRRIERGLRTKAAARPGLRRGERRQESDDEVRASLPPELMPLFERVKRSIRGSDRMTRTEAFLQYAEEHPDEMWEGLEARTDAVIAELERRQAMPNPKKRSKKKKSKPCGSTMCEKRAKRAAQRRRSKTRPPTKAERAAWLSTKPNPRKRPPPGSIKQGDLFMAPSGQLVLVDPSHEQRQRTKKASAAARTVPLFKNPRRPPKRWFDRCLRSVAAKKYARDPEAVCAAAWWRRPPAERERIVRRFERGSVKERRTAVAIAKAEKARADGRPPRRSNPGMSDGEAIAEYERTHWGQKGRQRVQTARAADPTRGTATKMGALVAVAYETEKEGDGRPVVYEHTFSRKGPRAKLLYNPGGLIIADGSYTIKKGGITG